MFLFTIPAFRMSKQNKHCPGIYGKCSKIMPYWDNHSVCRACRNFACSQSSTCEVCADWSDDLWDRFHKCLKRSAQTKAAFKSRSFASSQVSANDPGRSFPAHVPEQDHGKDSSSVLPTNTPVSSAISSGNSGVGSQHESQRGSPPPAREDLSSDSEGENRSPRRDPSPDSNPSDVQGLGSKTISTSQKSQSRPNVRPRSRDSVSHGHGNKRPRSDSESGSSYSQSDSRGRSRRRQKSRRRSRSSSRPRHRSRSLSKPRHRHHGHHRHRSSRSRSSYRHHRSRSPRSGSKYRHSRSRQYRHRSRSVSRPRHSQDPEVSNLSKLIEHQGQLLKELTSRMDAFPIASTAQDLAPAAKSHVIVESRINPSSHPAVEHEDSGEFQICVGDDERLGNSDPEDHEDQESESPKDNLSYKEAISRLRSRLGPEVCPRPEVKSKPVGASALDFFKDPEETEETSLALPQSNSVSVSLGRMDKRLKGEEEVPMSPLPTYPKAFKTGSFVSINSKPKIFQASSYEALNPVINMDAPSINPGLKDVLKQGSSVPSSHSLQFSTLENWEKLARTGIQVASHSEMFLCGTLKTIQQESCSKDDMLEVSRYLQAVAISQSHLVEILSRLASGPLLARRDACLAVSDLDSDTKQSLRAQPIQSSTIFGEKFPEVVKHYKDGLAHRSLQMAVVGANKSSGPKKKGPKVSESSAKPTLGELNVTVGSDSSRISTVPRGLPRIPKRNGGNRTPGRGRGRGRGKGPKPNAP